MDKRKDSKKILVTLAVMLCVIGLSFIITYWTSYQEEQACWEDMYQSADRLGKEIALRINSDQELLESVADIIARMDSVGSEEVQDIIDSFKPSTMIEHIALLLPEDKIMLPNEPIRDTGEILSFDEEAALGVHVSDRSVDIRDEDRMILRNFVPVQKDGRTIAMLYGVIDLKRLPEHFGNPAYSGEAAVYLMDGNTGNFIMDTWHNSLSNITELGDRKFAKGFTQEQFHQDIFDGKKGYSIFVSETIGENLYFYYEPVSINRWMIGLSVSEGIAFEKSKQLNMRLVIFVVLEILLLAGYFVWLLMTAKKELMEKQILAETDVLTGLLNRNSYEQNINTYPAGCKESLACVYVDVNGLHELNNTKGHAAGDRMLQVVAAAVQSRFGKRDTFRTGGDEFVAFARDEAAEGVQKKVEEINNALSEQGYHASVGLCRQKVPLDMNQLIKQAEQHMYEEKKRYYDEKSVSRRTV